MNSGDQDQDHPWSPASVFRQLSRCLDTDDEVPLRALSFLRPNEQESLREAGVTSVQAFRRLQTTQLVRLLGRAGLDEQTAEKWKSRIDEELRLWAISESVDAAADNVLTDVANRTHNVGLIDPYVLCSVDRLIQGDDELTIRNFHNLSNVTEAVVLHDQLVAPVSYKSLDTFRYNVEVIRELGLLIGPPPEESRTWTSCPLSSELEEGEVLVTYSTENGFGPLSSDANSLVVFNGVGMRETIGSVFHILYVWNTYIAAKAEDRESVRQLALRPSLILERLLTMEAERRGWHNVRDVSSFPASWTSIHATSRVREMMRNLDEKFRSEVKLFMAARRVTHLDIPMLTAILLARCQDRRQLPREMLRLREEFSGLRLALREFDRRIMEATSVRDFLQIKGELDKAWEVVLSKVSTTNRRLVRGIFDTIKSGSISKALLAIVDGLLKHVEERVALGRLRGFVDIWDQASRISDYESLLERCFGRGLTAQDAHSYGKLVETLEAAGYAPAARRPGD